MPISIGQKAPGFELFDTEKQKQSLAGQHGKNVVLLFFPLAFTSVCTAELCNVRDNIALYNQTNAQVFGISVDSVFTLAKFREEQHLNFPLLSDFINLFSTVANHNVKRIFEIKVFIDRSFEIGVSWNFNRHCSHFAVVV